MGAAVLQHLIDSVGPGTGVHFLRRSVESRGAEVTASQDTRAGVGENATTGGRKLYADRCE